MGDKGAESCECKNDLLPLMPLPMAIVCCIFNFLVPGFGTMLSGFSYICCPRDNDIPCGKRLKKCCQMLRYGLLTLLIFGLFFFGLLLSWRDGIAFIYNSLGKDDYNSVGTSNRGRIISQQPHSVIATDTFGYTPKTVVSSQMVVWVTNQVQQGNRLDPVVTVTNNESVSTLQHDSSTTHPPGPPPYPGLPSGPTD